MTSYENSLCSDCGHPQDEAYDASADSGYFDVREVTCAACKARQEHGQGKPSEPGTKLYVVHEHPPT